MWEGSFLRVISTNDIQDISAVEFARAAKPTIGAGHIMMLVTLTVEPPRQVAGLMLLLYRQGNVSEPES